MRMSRSWIAVLAGIAAVAFAAFHLWPASRVAFVEYRMSEAQDTPIAIAAGADGSIWFTLDLADAVGRVRDGRLERLPTLGKMIEPIGIAVGSDGVVWHTAASQRAIARVSAAGETTKIAIDSPMVRLGRMAAAPDGAIWFAEPTAHSVTRFKDGVFKRHGYESPRGGPYGVAAAPDGSVWATLQSAGQLLHIRPAGEVEAHDLPGDMAAPTDVAVAPDGAVWFLDFRANAVGRFKEGRVESVDLGAPSASPSGLAVAPDGAAWFGMVRRASLGRIRDGALATFKLPREDARPYSVTVDGSGNIWYADIRGYVGMLPARDARR